jgi:uncharacterized pyridoxamine 5'-phosphate oxidase family protein
MKAIPDEIVHFFRKQHFVIVSTIDKFNKPHSSCKGIVKIDEKGKIYILDLYKWRTYGNLKRNPHMSITAVDEHKFKGWCLKGRAKIILGKRLSRDVIKAWETRIAGRITHRLLKNIREEKGHRRHPEVQLPKPEYMIVMEIEDIVDLIPKNLGR